MPQRPVDPCDSVGTADIGGEVDFGDDHIRRPGKGNLLNLARRSPRHEHGQHGQDCTGTKGLHQNVTSRPTVGRIGNIDRPERVAVSAV